MLGYNTGEWNSDYCGNPIMYGTIERAHLARTGCAAPGGGAVISTHAAACHSRLARHSFLSVPYIIETREYAQICMLRRACICIGTCKADGIPA